MLGLNLSRRLGSARVSVYPAAPEWPVDAHVALEIDRLDGRLGEAVELEGRFTLLGTRAVTAADAAREGEDASRAEEAASCAPAGERLLAARPLRLREPVEGDAMEALVAAHSRLADALAREIAAAVREAGL